MFVNDSIGMVFKEKNSKNIYPDCVFPVNLGYNTSH